MRMAPDWPPSIPKMAGMTPSAFDIHGQPAAERVAPDGARVTAALHGGHVLSWRTADGVERLYLSSMAVFDGQAAIRGGVPVCFPQFNQRGPLPKHGLVRHLPWQLAAEDVPADALVLTRRDDDATRALWPAGFALRLSAQLAPQRLRIALEVRNTGDAPWSFTMALHTYLRVDDVTQARLEGLQGAARWDAVRDRRFPEDAPALRFGEEFDSVFSAPGAPLTLVQPRGQLTIAQSESCTETVVWNPGPQLAASLPDLPDDGWRQMLCVEAAHIDTPVTLAPGERWEAWQELRVAPA